MSKSVRIWIVAGLILMVGAVLAIKGNGRSRTEPEEKASPVTVVQGSSLPRLLELGSVKCIPCKMMEPILEELRQEYKGRLDVQFHDVMQDPTIGRQYGVQIIPTQIFFDEKGRERYRHEGFLAKQEILAKWRELGLDLDGSAPSRP